MKTILLSLLFLWCAGSLAAQNTVIVLPEDAPAADLRAAEVLRFYLGKITSREVPLLTDGQSFQGAAPIFIGRSKAAHRLGLDAPTTLPDDGFYMEGKAQAFALVGGGELGAEYAAYSLLELLGCRKYSPRDSFIPNIDPLLLPDYPGKLHQPAFPYRELWYEPSTDNGWARWHKLKTRTRKEEEWGMFVHTFQQLCPASTFFAEHPEYFSWNGAQRSPGQLCLSNDTVLQIVTKALAEKIRQKPNARYWSVSQNDNYDYCKCPRCAAADRRFGSPAGILVDFVNRIAAAFPDKTISTLAYQYTRQAPTGIRPAANVSVCLCSIECNRGLSIEQGCPDFARDVREWSALTENLMIWDYVVQFRSYLSPFPNWHTLQPNLQFFEKNKVEMMFEQGSGRDRSEFSDMRAYFLAKLMWDPQVNADSVLTDFGKGYYGAAQPFVWDYIDSLTTRLQKSDRWLGIYATPQVEAHSFLCEACMTNYLELMKKAAKAVRGNVQQEGKVLSATLPLVFALFELEKIRDGGNPATDVKEGSTYVPRYKEEDLDAFVKACQAMGYANLHEMSYPPTQYSLDYLQDMREGRVFHRFVQKQGAPAILIESAAKPSPNYEKGRLEKLVDSKRGTNDYHFNWLGFQGDDLDVTLRMPEERPEKDLPEASSVSVQFLQDQASWVFFPQNVEIAVSSDGLNFEKVHEEALGAVPDGSKKVQRVTAVFPARKVRAVRVTATGLKNCPPWHTCNGNPCWLFVDEVVVQ